VHGADVVTVTQPGEGAGREADAAVTTTPGAVLAVQTADCAPVLLLADGGIGVAHAGWRGLEAGVIEAAASALTALGTPPHSAVLGPCIRARCYEFGEAELALVEARYGPGVRSTTAWGTPALDLAAGVAEACRRLGLAFDDAGTCTACSPRHFSHRARSDPERQALVAWL
jgi:YfiH family protein